MENTELMQKMLSNQEKLLKAGRLKNIILIITCAVIIFGVAFTVPRVVTGMKNLEDTSRTAKDLADKASESLEGIDEMVSNVNSVVVENTSAVNEVISDFNDIDFETLNKAIKDLSDVVEPLANFFNRFR